MKKYLTLLLIFMMFLTVSIYISDSALSQEPIKKIGSRCPRYYVPYREYCIPEAGAREIIAKIGNRCPSGFAPDGDYCYRRLKKPSDVIVKKEKKCPYGYRPDGAYCVSIN